MMHGQTQINFIFICVNFILCTSGIRQSVDTGLQYQLLMSKEQWWNDNWHVIYRVQTAVHFTLDYWISRLFVCEKEKSVWNCICSVPRWKAGEMLTGLGLTVSSTVTGLPVGQLPVQVRRHRGQGFFFISRRQVKVHVALVLCRTCFMPFYCTAPCQ
jgi:hypothetical protein